MDWTTEQILGLAPDQFILRAGRGMADPQKWVALHQHGSTVWGVHPNGRNKPGETAVDLPSNSCFCTCRSRKTPCRHTLGLLLLWQQQPAHFTGQKPGRSLSAWVKREKLNQQRVVWANGRFPANPNLAQLTAGLQELELWLLDMVQHGLARLPERPKSYWETMAHRLVDAQAISLAHSVQNLAHIPASQPDWPEKTLHEIGRLYLIIQGFCNFTQLSPDVQADLQTAVGWLPTANASPMIFTDHWLVLGRQQDIIGSQTRFTTWLWGHETQKLAQLVDLNRRTGSAVAWLPTNSVWQGSLNFAPGSWPLLATRHGPLVQVAGFTIQPVGFQTVRAAGQAYGRALAANPWLPHFPMLLHHTQPRPTELGWVVEDNRGGRLLLPEKFTYGWHLLGQAGGTASMTLFGVWNGRFLQPLTIQQNQQWQDIHIWRGVR